MKARPTLELARTIQTEPFAACKDRKATKTSLRKRAPSPGPLSCGESLYLIKKLARERYLQLALGPSKEFDSLWSEAFQLEA